MALTAEQRAEWDSEIELAHGRVVPIPPEMQPDMDRLIAVDAQWKACESLLREIGDHYYVDAPVVRQRLKDIANLLATAEGA